MKKVMALALAALMVLSLAACGKKAQVAINSVEDLNGKKIGVQAGTTGEIYVQENVTDAQLGSYKSGMDAALDLKNGKIDAVMLDELPAKSIVAQNDDLTIIDFNLEPEEYAIAVKKGNTELLDAINATIARMQADGSYEALVNAFMPAEGEAAIKVPETIETSGDVIKMGTNAAFKPFEYAGTSEIVGFDISMAQNVAKDMGRKLQVEDMAFDSLLSALDTGTIDFVAAGIPPPGRARTWTSQALLLLKQVVIVRK
ncbi:MAG: transporter substrate-binding domain-containing protein [Anaerotruncus massiliensis (ex Togo et al. 2019)]